MNNNDRVRELLAEALDFFESWCEEAEEVLFGGEADGG